MNGGREAQVSQTLVLLNHNKLILKLLYDPQKDTCTKGMGPRWPLPATRQHGHSLLLPQAQKSSREINEKAQPEYKQIMELV